MTRITIKNQKQTTENPLQKSTKNMLRIIQTMQNPMTLSNILNDCEKNVPILKNELAKALTKSNSFQKIQHLLQAISSTTDVINAAKLKLAILKNPQPAAVTSNLHREEDNAPVRFHRATFHQPKHGAPGGSKKPVVLSTAPAPSNKKITRSH